MRYISLIIIVVIVALMFYLSMKLDWWGLKSNSTQQNSEQKDETELRGQEAVDRARENKQKADEAQEQRTRELEKQQNQP